jgi:hypothetical protein
MAIRTPNIAAQNGMYLEGPPEKVFLNTGGPLNTRLLSEVAIAAGWSDGDLVGLHIQTDSDNWRVHTAHYRSDFNYYGFGGFELDTAEAFAGIIIDGAEVEVRAVASDYILQQIALGPAGISQDLSLYVDAAAGSDSASGDYDHPWHTLDKALTVVSALSRAHLNWSAVSIFLRPGTYNTGNDALMLPDLSRLRGATVSIQPETTATIAAPITTQLGCTGNWLFWGVRLESMAITVLGAGNNLTLSNCTLVGDPENPSNGVRAERGGHVVIDTLTLEGSFGGCIGAYGGGSAVEIIGDLTLTTTPVVAPFCWATALGFVSAQLGTITGTATGARYEVALGGIIDTGGAGSTALPGNAAGTLETGGAYY